MKMTCIDAALCNGGDLTIRCTAVFPYKFTAKMEWPLNKNFVWGNPMPEYKSAIQSLEKELSKEMCEDAQEILDKEPK
jgi:hypothetical protein